MRSGADRKALVIVIMALLAMFSSACAQSKVNKMKSIEEHEKKALELRQSGDVRGAIQEQLKAIELNDKDVKLWVMLMRFYLDATEFTKAKEIGEKAIILDPKDAWAYFLYSEALERSGDLNNALKERRKAVELEPNIPLFLVNLGSIQESLGDNKSAKESYQKALNISPKDISAMYRLGSLEGEEGNIEKAIDLLERAIHTHPAENGDYVFIDAARNELDKIRRERLGVKP